MGTYKKPALVLFLVSVLIPNLALAKKVTIPAGTPVYGELQEFISSKKKEGARRGDIVRATVWRNVIVDGQIVLKAGAPLMLRIAEVKGAKMAGIKGKLSLDAVSATAVDGSQVLLDGGYMKEGRGRVAMTATLTALVAWPLIFIHGKHAELPPGTVIEAAVQSDVVVNVPEEAGRPSFVLNLKPSTEVEVLYDKLAAEKKPKAVPVVLRSCETALDKASVVTVNDKPIEPIALELQEGKRENDCYVVGGEIPLKPLVKHFVRGINRFEVEAGDVRTEVIFSVDM